MGPPTAARDAEKKDVLPQPAHDTAHDPAKHDESQAAHGAPKDEGHGAAHDSHDEGRSSTEVSPRLASAHPQPKKFSSLNINQRFLQSAATAAAASAAPKQAAPAPVQPAASRLSTLRPSARPAARTESPTSWKRSSSSDHPEREGNAWGSPRLTAATAAPAPDAKGHPTRAPWTKSPVQPAARTALSSHDFPTAAEVMEAERKAEEKAAAHAAEEAARQQAALKDLDRFRDNNANCASHWDEMDDESEESLDDVVEFGDGTQYKLPHDEPKPEPPKEAKRPANAWAAPLRTAAAEKPPLRADAPRPEPPRPTWGPLAQRHSTVTGQPLPKPEAPPAPKEPEKSAEEIAAEQQSEMMTAAERARKRREEEERAREAQRERARLRAQQIEEQIKAAEREKQEKQEAERRALAQRREEERLEREKAARERMAREDAARERAEKAAKERHAKETKRAEEAKARAADAKREADAKCEADAKPAEKREAEKHSEADAQETWRRKDPVPTILPRPKELKDRDVHKEHEKKVKEERRTHEPLRASSASPMPQAPTPEPAVTREELELEQAPVWRQFRVQLHAEQCAARRPSEAARNDHGPRDSAAHATSYEPPLDYLSVGRVDTAAEVLFPPRAPRVRLPSARLERGAPRRTEPSQPLDAEAMEAELVGGIDDDDYEILFREEPQGGWPSTSKKPVPRVHLPPARPRRAQAELLPAYSGGLFDRPQVRPPPLVSLPAPDGVPRAPFLPEAPSTWGAGPLALPMLEPAHDKLEQSHIKKVWAAPSASAEQEQPKNSLEGLVDDVLPPPLGMDHLTEAPATSEDAAQKLDVFASPFQPSSQDEARGPKPWPYLGTPRGQTPPFRLGYEARTKTPRAARTTRSAETTPEGSKREYAYMLPADYSDFVLSDAW